MKTYLVTILKLSRDVPAKEKEALAVHAESDLRAAGAGPIDIIAFESSMPIETIYKTLKESGMKFFITEASLSSLPKEMTMHLFQEGGSTSDGDEKLTLEEQIDEAAKDDKFEIASNLLKHSKEKKKE
jgi:hypothetical protein